MSMPFFTPGDDPGANFNELLRRVGLDAGAPTVASSNNLVKGLYAYFMSDRKTGLASLALLVVLALAGLAPLAWVWR